MADEPNVTNHAGEKTLAPKQQWFAHNSSSVIFLIIVIALVGDYQAFNSPVSVFPSTDLAG